MNRARREITSLVGGLGGASATALSRCGDEVPSRTTSVHIVDATNGPLVGAGRVNRSMPFVLTATVSLSVGIPLTSWYRPGLALAGCVLLVALIIGCAVTPWSRIARAAQLVPPFALLVATLDLMLATGHGVRAPFSSLIVLPLMWLALYENRSAVLVAAALTGVALWLAPMSGSAESTGDGALSIFVLVVSCAGMGITLHGLVSDARQLAISLRQHQHALEHLSLHDPLTDLSNRRGFAAESQVAREHAQHHSRPFSVLYIDLDHFKNLNDTLGHDVGDLLLKEVAERLRTLVRATDTVARLGGDEFAVLVDGSEPVDALLLAAHVETALNRPYAAAPEVPISASVGIAHSADAGSDPDAVLSAADTSMFTRKRERHLASTPTSGLG